MRKPLLSVAAALLLSAASFHAVAQETEKPAEAPAAEPAAPAGEAKPAGDAAAGEKGAQPSGDVVEGSKVPDATQREAVASHKEMEKQGPDEMGMYTTPEGEPTYNIKEDGTVDWYTYGGYRLYHAVCHVCHGPEAMGSTFAPALKDSLQTLTYEQFLEVVSSGRKRQGASGNSVMPAFGTDPNVICHINEVYVYLKARADGALQPGRPKKKEAKTDAKREAEEACRGAG